MPNNKLFIVAHRLLAKECRLLLALLATLITLPAFAAPIAVDDDVAVPSNTTVFANDLAANDTTLTTDTYTITVPPSNGTATLTTDGLLDYTPNIGFASIDTLTYSVDDGAGGVDTATVTLDVVLTSDFLTPGNNFLIGQEDIPTPLNLTVDPSLEFGGTLQDIIGVDALYRQETMIGVPVASTIPIGTTGINITGYATRNVGTGAADNHNDDYELISVNINLREATYSGRLTYSVSPKLSAGTIDQYTWLNVPLGQSVLTDTSYVTGHWTGDSDPLIELVSGQLRITETIPLQIAYHIEYMTADGDSADFVNGSGDVQKPNDTQSTFAIPAELEPNDGSEHGYIVLTGNSAADGSNFNEEHKGFSRLVADMEANTVSGVIASERGETDARVTTWSFVDYPLIDLRDTPGATPVSITTSTATRVGDSTATVAGVEDDPTIYIDATGALIVERATSHAGTFTTMYTSENYRRTGLSSIASFVGVESDTTLFDSNPPDGVDENGKPVNLQSFPIPASSSIGILQMSWQTIGGSNTNENVGYGFAVIDLNNNTSSGSITFSRATTPDLVAWQGVPIGTTMFGATDGGVALFQSNKAPGAFTDDYPETARFTLVNNADGSRTLEFTASSNAGTGTFADYLGTAQVSWLGSEPFSVQGVPATGTLSHGSPTNNGWEVDFADIPLLTISNDQHKSGTLQLDMLLTSTGELDSIIIHVEPVVDDPLLTASDVAGYVDNPVNLGISIGDSADIDGSETQLQSLTLSGVPTSVTLAANTGTVTNFGGGNWQFDVAALATLTATGTATSTATVTVSGTNTDTHDLDGDSVIEDANNGAGVDELDTVVYQETFELTILAVPTVTAQLTNTGTPVISGTATVGTGETLVVTVNGISYTAGDGNLVDNGDGTWDLTIPGSNTIADGTYSVDASLNHINGGSGPDITTNELVIDTAPPAIPTVIPLETSDATPIIAGTATVGLGEILSVVINSITYTAGDGNLIDNGDGTWELSISNPLSEGIYPVTTAVTDTAGNSSVDTTTNELTVQAIPLSTPTVVPVTTTDTTPVITGNAVIGTGDTLMVAVDGVTYTTGDGNLIYNSSGVWSLSISTPMTDGIYEVLATVTDVFGNPYPDTSSNELIIDTTTPVAPTVISQTTNDIMPIVSGTATIDLGETLTVMVDGVNYTAGDGNLVDNGDGTWELSVPVILAETTYSVTATVTDAAGNSATDSTNNELIIDATPPAIPTVAFQTTSDSTPIISGTATVGLNETLSVSVGGVTYSAGDGILVDNGDGTWDLSVATALADGNYSVTATIIDVAGNASDDVTALELTIDTTPPVTPTVAAQTTNATSPVITGTATVAPGDTLTVTVDGAAYTAGDGYLVDNGDGTWALSVPTTLAQGTFDVTATVVDLAGNTTSDSTTSELIIDLTAPVAPGVTSLATTDTTPVIEGTATIAAGETLTVEVNGVTYTAGDGDLIDNGDGTWALTIPATNILAENLYQVIASVTDAAGNSAADPGVDDLLVDLTAPNAPGVTSLTTNITTPTIEGTAIIAVGETLTVEVNGVIYTAGDGNLVDNGDDSWTLSIPVPLVEALYNVTATITDSAGNTSTDPSSSELLIDTTAPITPTTTPLITSDTTPVISGTANAGPGETLTVEVNSVIYTVGDGNLIDNGNGTWDLSIPAALVDGTYEVIATVTDAAGNISTDTNTNELVIDTIDPIVPTVNSLITNNNTPVITGTTSTTAGETLTVEINSVTYTAGDGNLVVNADGTWDLSIPITNVIADGVYEVITTIIDLAGNSTSDATNNELTVDTAAPVIPTVTTQNTSNTTPVIVGTATVAPGETLTVTVDSVTYTAGDGNLVDNGDGTWTLTVPNPLTDSTYPVVVTVIDAASNASVDVTTSELTIDTTAPLVPTVVSQTTNNTTPVITGTATVGADETLTVSLDGITYTTTGGDLVDNGNGTWALTVPAPMVDGNYEVTATLTDTAGNTTDDASAVELTIDTTVPVVPTAESLLTNNTTPVISGTATVNLNEILTVSVGGVTYTAGDGFLVDNGDGTWDLSIPTALLEGTYEVIATVTDAAGNASTDISANELVIDTTAPTTPTVLSQNTNNTTPTITGTATVAPDDTLEVTVNGTTYTAGDGFLFDNGDGTWTLSVPAPLAEGSYDVDATVTDLAGNASTDTTAGELIIDLTAPVAPGVTSQITNNTTPIIEGTATVAAGETLTVEVNGITYTAGDGDLVDNGDGTWTLTIPAANTLAENLYQVIATVTDAAGNSAVDPGVDDLLVDLTAPNAPGVTSLTTNDTTPTIEGTAIIAVGETLTVEVNAVIYTAGDGNLVDNGDGTWALSIPAPLVEALYNVTATITDSAGNTSTDPSSSELLIDTTAPITPTTTPLITSDTTPVISGTANAGPGETLKVEVDGVTYTAGDGDLTDNGDGTWDLSIPAALVDGTYEVIATVTDAAGNISADTNNDELVIDTIAPIVPTVNSLITNNNTPVITGTTSTTAGETLTVLVDSVNYTAGDGNLIVNTDGTWELSIPATNVIADGVYEVIATIIDLAGNSTSDATNNELTVDTAAPVIPTVTTQNTSNTSPVINGTATVGAGETLTVSVDGVTYTAGDGNLADNGDGTWTLTAPTPLTDSTYPVAVTVVDAAGNASVDVTTSELTIDTTAPLVPTVASQITNNTTPSITGTATVDAGETLTVTLDGTTYSAGDGFLIDNGNGTWTLSVPVPLSEGSFDVVATVTDLAGNMSTDTTAGELIIDLTAPVAPGVTSQITNNTTPIIEGTATVATGEILSVEVNGVTYTAGDGDLVDNGDGTWTLTIPATNILAENLYQVVATVTDAAGNNAVDPGVDELLVDLTAPNAPGVTSLTTNNTTPAIEGTATVAPGETLSVEVNGVIYTAGDGNLVDNGDDTWTLSIPVPLVEALYNVTATITDSAGNTSTDPSSSELLIDTTAPITPTTTPQITSDTTPVISGTANAGPGETLTVTVDGITYTAGDGNLVDNGDGTWDLSIPAALVDGTYEVIATVTDAAGNISTDTNTDELVIDTIDPIVPIINSLITNNTTPVITGTTSTTAGETLTVLVDGVTYTAGDGNLVVNADGTWDLSIPSTNMISDGVYEVIATITDLAGNSTSDATNNELTVDTAAPVIPTVTTQNTSNTTPVIVGTATIAPGEALTVTVDGVTYTAGDGNLVDNSDGTWTLTVPNPLTDSTYPVAVTVVDAAGNASVDVTTSELTIDTTAPLVPTVVSQITNNTTPVITGTATVGASETLTVTLYGITYTTTGGDLVNNGNGTWALTVPAPMVDGNYEVIATVTDTAGNVSNDTTASELIIDLTAPVAPGVTNQITNNTTPIIEGTATVAAGETLTVEVNGVTYNNGDGNLIDNGDGTWTLTIPAANSLAENLYQVIATVTDTAGNNAVDPDVDDLVVDLTVPNAPAVTSQATNNTTPTIEGTTTVAPGETLTVTVDGVTYTAGDGFLIDNGDGTWSLSVPVPLAEGSYDVVATVTDLAGNVSTDTTAGELIIDLTVPVAPGVTSLATTDTTPVIEGTAIVATGETLTIEVNSVIYTAGDGNLIDNGDGTWTLAIPATNILAENLYQVIATVTDAAGNSAVDPGVDDLLVDLTTPNAPGVTSQTTNNTTPTIDGTATVAPGETLSVEINGVIYTAGDGNLVDNGDGTWALSIPAPLVEALYNVTATITDSAGNTSNDPSSSELLIDTTAPITPTTAPLITSDTTPVISGTANAGPAETLTVEVNGVTYTAGDGNLVDNGDGTWDLSIPAALVDGTYEVIVTVTDAAGNISTDTNTNELVIDTALPITPTTAPLITSDTTPVISGTATVAPGETLTVEINGVTYIAGDGNLIVNADGTWDLTIPAANVITDGVYAVFATITDLAGNSTSDATNNELTVDTTAPVIPTVTSQNTNNTTPIITGTATVGAGETLTVNVNGTTYAAGDGNLVDNGDGTWALPVPLPLAEGSYDIVATVTDLAGNVAIDTTAGELIIDLIAPVAPGVTSLATTDTTPMIEGIATIAAGETLTVEVNGVTYTAGDGNLIDNGDGTWTLTIPAINILAENLYQVIATVTDAAGNSAVDPGVDDLLVDLTTPNSPGVTSQTTNNTTPTIAGTATISVGETLTIEVYGVTYTAGDGNLVNNGDGTWTLSIPVPLFEALYDVTATIIDSAGNTSNDPSSSELLIDTTAPITPTTTPLITSDTTPVISGTANAGPGETLTVTVDGITYTAADGNLVDNGDGTWDLTIPTALVDGTYEVVVTVTDAAGNISTDTNTNELVIDTALPITPTTTPLITSDTTPVIAGTLTVAPGETLAVTVDGVTYTAGDDNLVVNADGTWDLSIPATNIIADGVYEVIATITDLAGNSISDATNNELTVDTAAPVIPTVTTQNTSNTTPGIIGTATVGAGETLTVTLDGTTYTEGDGNLFVNGDGTWTLTVPNPLTDSTYPVAVTVIDAAGNASVDVTTAELTIDTTVPLVPVVVSQITNNTTPVISGTATVGAGESLTVALDGTTYSAGDGYLVDNVDGTWTLSVSAPLAEGSYEVVATVTDLAGNASTDTTASELIIDLTAPVAPGVTSQITSNSTPVIEGTAAVTASETLTVEVNDVTYTAGDGNLIDNVDGTWILAIPAANVLAENLYQVIATVTDAAGNSAVDTGEDDLLIDLTTPNAPGVTSLSTNDTTPTIAGTANIAAGETLTVEVNGVIYTAGDGNLVDNVDSTWTLSIPVPLVEALYDVTATITDSAGNISTDPSSSELLIDTTLPTTPTITPLFTSDTTPVISGTASAGPGETLTVEINGVTYIVGDGNLVDNGNGTWTLSIPATEALAENLYQVIATITDAAGNSTIDSDVDDLLIDLTAPNAPAVVSQITNTNTPTIEGTATIAPGETLSVEVDGVIYTASDGNLVDNGDGTWTLTLPVALPDGVYDVITTVTDEAGNSSSDTSIGDLVIDTTQPPVPTVESLTTENTSPTLTGTATFMPGDALTVTLDGVTYTAGDGSLVVNTNGTWTLDILNALPEGEYQVQVSITDAAGNTAVSDLGQLTIRAALLESDFDGDGVPDAIDLDDDNDGIPDEVEGLRDSDGDGQPDYQDLDSDNDGIADIVEVNGEDENNDYRVDSFIDTDNNGLSDDLQIMPFILIDSDNDRVADFRDLDSDNDGITDLFESGGADSDHNGLIDNFFDDNNDGADDANQINGAAGRDTDGDGIPNRLDVDTDNDGFFDLVEAGDSDENDDGILDSMQDHDLDGIPDNVDVDITNGADADGDNIDDRFDSSFVDESDLDADGIIDSADPDANGDGFADDISNKPALGLALPDSNGNGKADLFEANYGAIIVGLQGHGCSTSRYPKSTVSMDPLLLLIMTISCYCLWRRSRTRHVKVKRHA